MNLKDILISFIDFREEIITKRTIYDLNKAREKAHILIGLVVSNDNIEKIIGHYQVESTKECPSFDVPKWLEEHGLV